MGTDSILTLLFLILLGAWIYSRRDKVQVQKILFPILYFIMYKSSAGIKAMDRWAKKFPRLTLWFGYLGIVVGFLGMAFIAVELVRNVIMIFVTQAPLPGVGIVAPIKTKGFFFVPFFYWIISIFFIAVVHEFSHGLVARRHNIRIKSSGLAFLSVVVPVLPAAFVEPDMKQMDKKPLSQQLAMLGAGPFINIIFGFIFLGIVAFLFAPVINGMTEITGVAVTSVVNDTETGFVGPAAMAGIQPGTVVSHIDGEKVDAIDVFTGAFDGKLPGDSMTLTVDGVPQEITLGSHPDNASRAYLGLSVLLDGKIKDSVREKYNIWVDVFIWFFKLMQWMFLLNLGIGLFNLVPMGPLDGGRMALLVLNRWLGEKRGHAVWKAMSTAFLVVILFIVGSSFFG
ncbi:MAG: site-2 protease family protein [archaeon]